MSDHLSLPSVVNTIKAGKFTLKVYAYRKLKEKELLQAVKIYLKQNHIKKLPTSGTASLITTIGSNPADNI